jgi:RIO-like serine/threonine protein kinase
MEVIVAHQFRVGPRLGIGNNAEVYVGTHVHTGEEVALKLEPLRSFSGHLENEHKVYQTLSAQGM